MRRESKPVSYSKEGNQVKVGLTGSMYSATVSLQLTLDLDAHTHKEVQNSPGIPLGFPDALNLNGDEGQQCQTGHVLFTYFTVEGRDPVVKEHRQGAH